MDYYENSIAGTGYVGLANAMLLAQHNEVVTVDIIPEKIELLKSWVNLLYFNCNKINLATHIRYVRRTQNHRGAQNEL